MIQENEILTIILGAGVLHFIIIRHAELKRNPSIGLLLPAFYLLFAAWVASILETFFWEIYLNFIEHVLYLLSALCLLIWMIRFPHSPEESEK